LRKDLGAYITIQLLTLKFWKEGKTCFKDTKQWNGKYSI